MGRESPVFFVLFCFFKFYFIFKLYKIVLVLPNIKMNPPQVYIWFCFLKSSLFCKAASVLGSVFFIPVRKTHSRKFYLWMRKVDLKMCMHVWGGKWCGGSTCGLGIIGPGDSFLLAPCVDEEKFPPFSSMPCAHVRNEEIHRDPFLVWSEGSVL